MRRVVAGLVATGVAALAAVPALAHNKVSATSPKKGTTVSRSLSAVSVTFDKPIRRGTISVKRSTGEKVSIGNGGRDPRKISRLLAELRGPLKAGSYKVAWSAKVPDGHTQKGTFRFRVR